MLDDLAICIETEEVRRDVFLLARPGLMRMQSDPIPLRDRLHELKVLAGALRRMVEDLADVEMAVVVRVGHPLAGAKSLQDLIQGQWLHQGAGRSASVLIQRIFADLKLPVPPTSVESRSLTATIMMLQAMDLIAVMPRAMLEFEPLMGKLMAVGLKERFRPNVIGLIYRADRPLTRVVQIFATHTRRAAAHLPRSGNVDKGRARRAAAQTLKVRG